MNALHADEHEPAPRFLVSRLRPAIRPLDYPGPVIFDCVVVKHENCFPMIPSGKAHNEMLLGQDATDNAIDAGGAVLV